MYHPTRGGVRGGRDQFSWDDVKQDKHRENYLGHSIKAPVGRWQKGKDLHWYVRDQKSGSSNEDALKEEIKRIKDEEEQSMREALGLAPKRSSRPQGNRLDKHEYTELVKRGSTAEDLGAGHADAARVDGLGFSSPSTLPSIINKEASPEPAKVAIPDPPAGNYEEEKPEEDKSSRKKRRHEEKKYEKEKKREKHDRHEKHYYRDSDEKKHKKDKERRRQL
ncbi:multiple myeloma tumor-associated protein [Salix suchowensis]|nr:multiple myeloma tumor-associated protein [Salix suchowensis]